MAENNSSDQIKNVIDQNGNATTVSETIQGMERNNSNSKYQSYKEALETKNAHTVSALTANIFKTGGKKALDELTDFVINNYFLDPNCSETMLKKVASLFMPAINQSGVSLNFHDLEYRIRDRQDLNFGKKDQAVSRLYYSLDEQYRKPSNDPEDPTAKRLQERLDEVTHD